MSPSPLAAFPARDTPDERVVSGEAASGRFDALPSCISLLSVVGELITACPSGVTRRSFGGSRPPSDPRERRCRQGSLDALKWRVPCGSSRQERSPCVLQMDSVDQEFDRAQRTCPAPTVRCLARSRRPWRQPGRRAIGRSRLPGGVLGEEWRRLPYLVRLRQRRRLLNRAVGREPERSAGER